MTTAKERAKGLVLTFIGGLALSFDVPLVRLAEGDAWSVITVRSLFTFAAALVLWWAIGAFGARRPALLPGRAGAFAAVLYGISTIFFLGAVFNTSSANVVFIVAFNPMFAALLAWLFLAERPATETFVTMAVMVAGVGLIVSGSLSGGHLAGDLMSATAAFLLAGAITIGRATRRDMGFVPLIGALIPALAGLAAVGADAFAIGKPFWIALDGVVMIPLAFWCLANGTRHLTAAEVGMFYLLETVLAPVWVWWIFGEVPTLRSLAGGAILTAALVGYSLYQMRPKRGPAEAVTR